MLISFTHLALKQLKNLEPQVQKRIKKKLAWYISHEDPLAFADKLTDSRLGTYRYRIGDYRLPFDIIKNTIYINRVAHRKNAYRRA